MLGEFYHFSPCVLRQSFSLNLELNDYLDWPPSKLWGSSLPTLTYL